MGLGLNSIYNRMLDSSKRLVSVVLVALSQQQNCGKNICPSVQYVVYPTTTTAVPSWLSEPFLRILLDLCICVWKPTDRPVSAELVQVRILHHNAGHLCLQRPQQPFQCRASVSPTASICGFLHNIETSHSKVQEQKALFKQTFSPFEGD